MTFRYLLALAIVWQASAQSGRLQSSDLYKLRSVGEVRFSPDGARIAYTVSYNDGAGRPYSRIGILTPASGTHVEISGKSSNPVWSPDSLKIAYEGEAGGKSGLVVANADGSNPRFLSKMEGTNAPLTFAGAGITWSPDSKRIAFIDARPGPETKEASGDPVVITRYLYKPNFSEGNTRFNDNKRLHIFLADVSSGAIRQLTDGPFYEHSPDWSPNGEEILFVSNREPDSDQFFNDDIWTVRPADGVIRRVTATEYAEYNPRWSPDGRRIAYLGTRRGLTDLETTMEDTHVWVMNADGGGRTEIGKVVDNRQGAPEWAPGGQSLYFTVQERGNIRLYSLPVQGGAALPVIAERGQVGSWSVAKGNRVAYAFSSPHDLSELYLLEAGGTKQLTRLNDAVLGGKAIAEVEAFTFVSNDFKYEVEAFLTVPPGRSAGSRHPLIVNIHGGPHAQQGPAFNTKNQIYAGLGWASLMVNYRGSTGYGQKFADAVFGDQNGNEGQDVLYGVNAAIRRNPWIDRGRMGIEGGSYGGQLSAWLVTQTHIFKAAIPLAPIINLVSYNYMTYYNMYEQMEFGIFPHQGDLMDEMWRRSSLRKVAQVKTPVMLLHGENDNDVPIAESEQFYIALKDAGVEAVMVRYPREGHGLRETKHVVDSIDRSIAWYRKHFPNQ
ncbi:MAG: Dipeptidyl-peptidase 5 [Bryobacteraceae bacterium]|nr:Dipeptidyl-peptidase 5 [Bryobacteraceae bacterium]